MKLTLNEDTLFEDGLKVKTAQIRKWLKKMMATQKQRRPQNKDHLKWGQCQKEDNLKMTPKAMTIL